MSGTSINTQLLQSFLDDLCEQDATRARQAHERIVDLFGAKLQPIVKRRIKDQFRAIINSESVVNETFAAFFRAHAKNPQPLKDRKSLLNRLVRIAINRIVSRVRHEEAKRRSPGPRGGRTGIDDSRAAGSVGHPGHDHRGTEVHATDELERGKKPFYLGERPKRRHRVARPTSPNTQASDYYDLEPLELALFEAADVEIPAMAHEAYLRIDEKLRPTFDLYIKGYTDEEIGAKLGITPAKVRRQVDQIEDVFLAYFDTST